MCTDVIMLRAGVIVDQGSPAALIERYGRETMEEVFLDIARGTVEVPMPDPSPRDAGPLS
jgi:ABC-2 type transport system ATP-binding protein